MKKKVKKSFDDGMGNDRHDMIHNILRSVGNGEKFRRDLESNIVACRGTKAQKDKAMEIVQDPDIQGQKEWNRAFVTIHALLEKMTGVKFY